MLKSCKYCNRIHDSKYDCGKKPIRRKDTTEAVKVRNTRRWRKKREQIKERDGHLCRWCLAHHIITYEYTEVHHIIPLSESIETAYDDDWLITLCEQCHLKADSGAIDRMRLHTLAISPPATVGQI